MSIDLLTPEHFDSFIRALTSIISTNLTEFIFAQIIDGLPVKDNVGYQHTWTVEIRDNSAPSQDAITAAKQFQASFEVKNIQLDVEKVQRYQNTIPGSHEFSLQLLELLAIAFHDIAAFLYTNTQPGIRSDVQDSKKQAALLEDRKTNFMLAEYMDWQQYPKGISDMVGYWAEYHLFGGVVLFDRGDSGTDGKNVFLHPVAGFMIFQLSDTQIRQFREFVGQNINSHTSIPPPFPFRAERYARRVDPFDAMCLNIYRDKYERVIPALRPPEGCIRRAEDDPEYQDRQDFLRELFRKRDAHQNSLE